MADLVRLRVRGEASVYGVLCGRDIVIEDMDTGRVLPVAKATIRMAQDHVVTAELEVFVAELDLDGVVSEQLATTMHVDRPGTITAVWRDQAVAPTIHFRAEHQ